MCYVVAKNANKIGSVAIRMKLGKAVVQLKEEMNDQYLSKHIQFVTISRPSAYGEYAPYHLWTRFRSSRRKSRSCDFPQSCNSPTNTRRTSPHRPARRVSLFSSLFPDPIILEPFPMVSHHRLVAPHESAFRQRRHTRNRIRRGFRHQRAAV